MQSLCAILPHRDRIYKSRGRKRQRGKSKSEPRRGTMKLARVTGVVREARARPRKPHSKRGYWRG